MDILEQNTNDRDRALDAMCLVEQPFTDKACQIKYRDNWDAGIYAFRQLCWDLSLWTESAWQFCERFRGNISFDAEFCPNLIYNILTDNKLNAFSSGQEIKQAVLEYCMNEWFDMAELYCMKTYGITAKELNGGEKFSDKTMLDFLPKEWVDHYANKHDLTRIDYLEVLNV